MKGNCKGLAVLVAPALALALAVALAACSGAAGGGSGGSRPVASLPTTAGGSGGSGGSGKASSQPAGNPRGNPAQLLVEWTSCIRRQGDPNQVDPTIDSSKDIEISMVNVPKALEDEVHSSAGPCSNYLLAAEIKLRGGQAPPTDNPAQDVKFADCMRANGEPNWPDSSSNGETSLNGTGINPDSPAVRTTIKLCDKKTGIPYIAPGSEVPGVVVVTDCNAPAGMQCPKHPPVAGGGGPAEVPSPNSASGGNG
jgi:hypothetical protein